MQDGDPLLGELMWLLKVRAGLAASSLGGGVHRAEQTKTPQCPLAHTGTAVPQGGVLGVTSSASLALG